MEAHGVSFDPVLLIGSLWLLATALVWKTQP